MAEVIGVNVVLAVRRMIVSLNEVRSIKKHNLAIVQEIQQFITSLNENVDLLKKQLPNKTWAVESLEKDLNEAASYLEDSLKNGSFQKFWDAKQIKDKLERLRQDLINKFQVKVTLDADKKMGNFESKMVELSSLNAAETHAEMGEIRKLLQPLVVGMRRQDQRIQSFVSVVRQNDAQLENSTETQKFLADVLANLEDLTKEGSSARPTPPPSEAERDDYLDPITAELMIDPVKCSDGDTYDRLTVFQNNLTQQKPLVIVCDDVTMRRCLYKKFQEENVETKFRVQRKSYWHEALQLADDGQSAEALVMLKNVLQWAPEDNECLKKSNELHQELADKKRVVDTNQTPPVSGAPFQYSVPPFQYMVPPEDRRTEPKKVERLAPYWHPVRSANESYQTIAIDIDPC